MEFIKLEKIPLREFFNISWILNTLTIFFSLFFLNKLPPQIPVFYGLPQGEAQLSTSLGILIPPTVSLVFIFINLLLVSILKDELIKKTLVVTGLATSIFAVIATFKIIFLIGQI